MLEIAVLYFIIFSTVYDRLFMLADASFAFDQREKEIGLELVVIG